MQDDLQIRRRRAIYRASHRGTKEMDIILGRYAEARVAEMPEVELEVFERFLALPDPMLTTWFSQGAASEEGAEFAPLVEALRDHFGLRPAAGDKVVDRQ